MDSDHRHACQPIVTLVREQIETHSRSKFSGDDNASTMAARIRRLPYSKALLAAPQPHGWGGTSESRARRPTGFPGRASAPWVRAKVHTGVTRGSIQFIAPFREPEK